MEILFKDNDACVYYIDEQEDKLIWAIGSDTLGNGSTNVKHLDEIEPLFYYRRKDIGELLSVYYEYNGRAIVKSGSMYGIIVVDARYTKDYTITNLKLI